MFFDSGTLNVGSALADFFQPEAGAQLCRCCTYIHISLGQMACSPSPECGWQMTLEALVVVFVALYCSATMLLCAGSIVDRIEAIKLMP